MRPRTLRVGGVTPFTTLDYPGKLAAVVYVQGCPWRCGYCHNPQLQAREALDADPTAQGRRSWTELHDWLRRRVGLIDAVVFSGGEPTVDGALPAAIADVRKLGYAVGLHSAGIYPRRLAALLPQVDWVGLDVKAPLDAGEAAVGSEVASAAEAAEALHERITGAPRGLAAVRASLQALRASGVAFECRTTAHPDWLDDAALRRLAAGLRRHGVTHYALQLARAIGCAAGGPTAMPAGYPAPATLAWLEAQFPSFTLRCG